MTKNHAAGKQLLVVVLDMLTFAFGTQLPRTTRKAICDIFDCRSLPNPLKIHHCRFASAEKHVCVLRITMADCLCFVGFQPLIYALCRKTQAACQPSLRHLQ